MPTALNKNDIVDYYDNRRIACAIVVDIEDRKVRILTDQGKEAVISPTRALTVTRDPEFPVGGSKDAQIGRLKAISSFRDEVKRKIDLKELWEVVGVETDEITLTDLSDLFFGNRNNPELSASLLRAIFEDRLYFRLKPDKIEVPSADRVEQALLQREKEREKELFVTESAKFLARLKDGQAPDYTQAPEGLLAALEEAAMLRKEWNTVKPVRQMISQAELPANWDPFTILVKLRAWSEDENISLRSQQVPIEFSRRAEEQAVLAAGKSLPESAEDLTNLHAITIDAPSTRDVDDALSLEFTDHGYRLGVHIADAAHYIDAESSLDQEISRRATSIYLPDLTIPMLPRVLSEQAASLVVGETKPALSLLIDFGPDFSIKKRTIVESVIKVRERLSYEEADERIARTDSTEAVMFRIACASRQRRINSGAIIFRDPEICIRLSHEKGIELVTRDRETPSQILVSELMILANNLFASFLKHDNIPGIFRSQLPPLEKVELGADYDPVQSYRCKKVLSRGELSTRPASHSTLGLDVYTTATSPLRRYPDLVTQRQLKAVLSSGDPRFEEEDLEEILADVAWRLEQASLLERERQKYYVLKYLEQHKEDEFAGIVLHKFPKFYLMQLSFGFNAALSVSPGVSLNPGDRCRIKVEKVNPKDDKLTFSLVELLSK